MWRILFIMLLVVSFAVSNDVFGQAKDEMSFEQRIEKLQKIDGFMPLYWDAKGGKMWLEISRFNQEFL